MHGKIWGKITMTYSIGNPGPSLGQAQKCGRV
jgi:hypothetical protein